MFTIRSAVVLALCIATATAACTVAKDCHGHADSVTEAPPGNCVCDCRNEWDGSQCQTCPAKYNISNDCDGCAQGFSGTFPTCEEVCVPGFGNDERYCVYAVAANVAANGTCLCTCYPAAAWYGPRCYDCPPHFDEFCTACNAGYNEHSKQCYLQCTNAGNCSNNADTVTGDAFTGCNCNCKNKWFGNDCSSCPTNISTAAACAACIPGFEGFPNCSRKCTVGDDCTVANTVEATGNERTGCTCNCRNQWSGDKCQTCPPIYNEADNCGSCATGYAGFPNCSRLCTNDIDCSGHASAVSGTNATGCTCDCRNEWFGGNCSECPVGYENVTCATCLPGRGGPNCEPACDVVDDCNNHATSVDGFGANCTCACRNGWRNETCDSCTTPYNGTDCQHCITDFHGTPPDCRKICKVDVDCNSHATSTEGFLNGTCACYCRNSWSGDRCETCASRYNASQDCGACNEGYEHYPNCSLVCEATANCSGNAVSVTGNSDTGCNCTCRNEWTGPTCSFCPDMYDPAKDCGECAFGYEGTYPNCTAECTLAECNFHALNVSGVTGGCNCTCRSSWAGEDCGVCPPMYNPVPDCDGCAAGFVQYPQCFHVCTTAENCTAHAVSVNGTAETGCNCSCRNEWHGAVCDQCPTFVNATKDCGACEDGFSGYPSCTRTCTMHQDCNNNAVSVTGVAGNCSCVCRHQWEGDSCAWCNPLLYNETDDCSTCAEGLREYPKCLRDCNTTMDCSGHATNVTGDTFEGCNCTCRNAWSSGNCSECEMRYDEAADCGACAVGYTGYPECPRICTEDLDCSSHATSVSGVVPNCSCVCRWGWADANCSTCPVEYNATKDCHECADDYEGTFPNCYLKCTSAANCSDHAASVTGNSNTGCTCTCRHQWANATCADCVERYDPTQDCGQCGPGHTGYPACPRVCDVRTECNDHAVAVTGTFPHCTCNCSNHWEGDACDYCPPGLDPVANCGACATGFQHYPNCTPVCDIVANCSNHASSVSGNEIDGCNCTCRGAWSGDECGVCPPTVNEAQDCGTCKLGYGAFPACRPKCTNADCTFRSLDVSGIVPDCHCDCINGYAGNCSVCPENFNATDDCASCMPGYVKYPDCWRICDADKDCSGHATNVTGDTGPPGCNCTCRNHWNGTDCSTCPINYDVANDCNGCAAGYVDYPFCYRLCTNVTDCSGHADTVSGVYPNCTCGCRNAWNESDCSVCPANFDEPKDCGECAWRHEDYPNCSFIVTPTLNTSMTGTLAVTQTITASADTPTLVGTPTPTGTMTLTSALSATREHTASLRLCDYQLDCNGRATAASTVAAIPADVCVCDCIDSWISPALTTPRKLTPAVEDRHIGCSMCPHEYGPGNVSLPDNTTRESDCAGCAEATTADVSEYPICRYGRYVVGTWTLEDCPSPLVRTQAYLDAVAKDLQAAMAEYVVGFGNVTSLNAAPFGQGTGCPFPLPLNYSFPDFGIRAGPSPQHSVAVDLLRVRVVSVRDRQVSIEPPKKHRVLLFEVHLAANNHYVVDRHASCVSFALTNNTGALGTSWTTPSQTPTITTPQPARMMPVLPTTWRLENVEALLNSSGAAVPSECIVANNTFLAAPEPDSVCKYGCPAPFVDEPTETDLWFLWLIAGIIVLAALIALAVFLFRHFGVKARILDLPFFADPAKNTLVFRLAEDDAQELKDFTKTRNLVEDDDFDDL